MSTYDRVVEMFAEMDRQAIAALKECDEYLQREMSWLVEAVEEDIERFKTSGVLVFNADTKTQTREQPKHRRSQERQTSTVPGRSSTGKENVPETNPDARLLRRSASAESSVIMKVQSAPLQQLQQPSDNKTVSNNRTATSSVLENITVKVERLTEEFVKKHVKQPNSEATDQPIKKEFTEMPPPLRPPIKQTRKRKGAQSRAPANSDLESVQVKQELLDQESKKRTGAAKPAGLAERQPISCRDSDIQIEMQSIDTINLVDTDEEAEEKLPRTRARTKTKKKQQDKQIKEDSDNNGESGGENKRELFAEAVRVTRTKTRNNAKNNEAPKGQEAASAEQQKRLHSSSTEDDSEAKGSKTRPKRTKTKKAMENNSSAAPANSTFIAEEAKAAEEQQQVGAVVNEIGHKQILNETVVISKPAMLNETVIIQKPANEAVINATVVISELPNSIQHPTEENLMTEDEDVITSPVPEKRVRKIKQVFSPYGNSPVKKRVEAFEKLGAESNTGAIPKATRATTRALTKDQNLDKNSGNEATGSSTNIQKQSEIPKLRTTPVMSSRILQHPHSSSAVDKYRLRGFPQNTSSASSNVSASSKSKSALKACQADFQERELRRKQKEADAMLKRQAQLAKIEENRRKYEERKLKAQQTRDALEKEKQKLLEEAERVKQEKVRQVLARKEEAMQKVREETSVKRALALKKATEEKQREEKRNEVKIMPPYLKYEAPLLPTGDCYDSDDSNAGRPFVSPQWQKKDALLKHFRHLRFIDDHMRYLFCNGPQTPDLSKIFPSIEPHKLKRTSSAIWNVSGINNQLATVNEEEETTS